VREVFGALWADRADIARREVGMDEDAYIVRAGVDDEQLRHDLHHAAEADVTDRAVQRDHGRRDYGTCRASG